MLTATSLVWHCCKSHSRADFPAGFPLKFVCCSNMTMILELWFRHYSHFLLNFYQNSQFWSLDHFNAWLGKEKLQMITRTQVSKGGSFWPRAKRVEFLRKVFSVYYFLSVRHLQLLFIVYVWLVSVYLVTNLDDIVGVGFILGWARGFFGKVLETLKV